MHVNLFSELIGKDKYIQEEMLLALAVYNNSISSVDRKIQNGANVNLLCKKNGSEFNLLALAINNKSVKMLQTLLKGGANPNNIFGVSQNTALIYAVRNNKIDFVRELLLTHNINVNYQDKDGWSALTYAASENYLGIVEFLIQNGADISATNTNGKTALHEAARLRNFEIVKFLVNQGAEVNVADKDNWTALRYAIFVNDVNIIKFLLKNGVDNFKNNTKNENILKLIKDSEAADLLWEDPDCNLSDLEISDHELFASRYVNKIMQNEFGIDCSGRIDALKNNNTINDELKNKIIDELGILKQAQKDFNMECASIFAQSFVYIKNIDNNSDANSEITAIFEGIDSLSPVPLFKMINLWLKDKSYESPENTIKISDKIIELLKFYEQNSALNYEQAINILSVKIINNDDLRTLQQNITNANVEILQKHFAKLIPILDPNIVEHFLSFTMPITLKVEFIKAHNKFKNDFEKLQKEAEVEETAQKLETSIDENSEQQQEDFPEIIKEFIFNAIEVLSDIVKDVSSLGDNKCDES